MTEAIFRGQFVKINYAGVEHTEELVRAMNALDADCAYGSGGTWDIVAEDPGGGVPYRAVFNEMATDELVWNSAAVSWTDGQDDEEEEEDDEEEDEDEKYMLAFVE